MCEREQKRERKRERERICTTWLSCSSYGPGWICFLISHPRAWFLLALRPYWRPLSVEVLSPEPAEARTGVSDPWAFLLLSNGETFKRFYSWQHIQNHYNYLLFYWLWSCFISFHSKGKCGLIRRTVNNTETIILFFMQTWNFSFCSMLMMLSLSLVSNIRWWIMVSYSSTFSFLCVNLSP